jgi:hypothetical protein
MTAATTMPDADLEDPLELAALEAALSWATTGPLPSWLDGTDLSDTDDMSAVILPDPEPIAPPEREKPVRAESRVETLAEVGEKTEPRVDMSASALASSGAAARKTAANRSESRPSSSFDELLALVNIVSQCSSGVAIPKLPEPEPEQPVEIITPFDEPAPFGSSQVLAEEPRVGSSSEPTEKEPVLAGPLPPEPAPLRRTPALGELAAARDCVIVEAGARCWAVPLHAVVCLRPWPTSPADVDVDLAEELGDIRPRGRSSRRWVLETTGATFGVDGLRGSGSIAWSAADAADSPSWMLAQAEHLGEPVGLIDLERWRRNHS